MLRLFLALVISVVGVTHANLYHVPADYATIQAAILATNDGDTVIAAEGTYVENIDFRGHSIVVGSQFLLDSNIEHVPLTIIDGSQPQFADTGSVVRIISGEDSTTALIGFTITGGTGTKFRDQSDQQWYVEGGGVIIENSDPLIAFNMIVNNQATRQPAGTQSAGGGGIRYGYCSPRIHNNVIMHNSGKYGGGVVSFFADGDVQHNVIANNDGGQAYGGGGLWIGGTGHATSVVNNSIVGNSSVQTGGGIRLYAGVLNAHSNIVWGNQANSGSSQIGGSASNIHVQYSCVEGGIVGTGNISEYPEFLEQNLRLTSTSPCVDAGNSDPLWNDQDETPNDIGVYGGPGAHLFPEFGEPMVVFPQPYPLLYFNCDTTLRSVNLTNNGTSALLIDSLVFAVNFPLFEITYSPAVVNPVSRDSIEIYASGAGGCVGGFDTLQIYHHAANAENPLLVPLYLDPAGAAGNHETVRGFAFHSAYPNPFNPSTSITFSLPSDQFVQLSVTDILGREVSQLIDDRLTAGEHSIEWNAGNLPSGTYIAVMRAGKWQAQTKLTLVK